MSILYLPGKANIVKDVLSRISTSSVAYVEEKKKKLVYDVHRLARFGVQLVDHPKGGFIVQHISDSFSVLEVNYKQHLYPILIKLKESVLKKFVEEFSQGGHGVLRYHGRLCVPNMDYLR